MSVWMMYIMFPEKEFKHLLRPNLTDHYLITIYTSSQTYRLSIPLKNLWKSTLLKLFPDCGPNPGVMPPGEGIDETIIVTIVK